MAYKFDGSDYLSGLHPAFSLLFLWWSGGHTELGCLELGRDRVSLLAATAAVAVLPLPSSASGVSYHFLAVPAGCTATS